MGILEMDFERILGVPFFHSSSHSIMLCSCLQQLQYLLYVICTLKLLKVAFFRECNLFFRSPNLKKKVFQKTILSLKFKFSANNSKALMAGNLNIKLRIVFSEYFFLRFGDLKNKLHFLKKATFSNLRYSQ
jgi:hypothetical protein